MPEGGAGRLASVAPTARADAGQAEDVDRARARAELAQAVADGF